LFGAEPSVQVTPSPWSFEKLFRFLWLVYDV
jgi:hypothetical protein